MISGILPVDKPAGWTSHDVVARVRQLAGQRRVGHAGTLDPLATGLLLVLLGTATRLSSYLMTSPKQYCADVVLGATTATDDAEAPLQSQTDVSNITLDQIERCLADFRGTIDQLPPAYAAVRHQGEKLYALARKGVDVERTPRSVTIYMIRVDSWQTPRLRLRVSCGPGTYIRSLARDVGAALGVGGYLHALRRTASGSFRVTDSSSLADLNNADAVRRGLVPLERAVLHLPALILSSQNARAVLNGQAVSAPPATVGDVRLYSASGTLIALAHAMNGLIKPFRVLSYAYRL